MLQASQDKATAFIMAVFSLPTGSGLKYQNAEQRAEIEAAYSMRKALNGMKSDEALERILDMFMHSEDNKAFVNMMKRTRLF